MMEIGEASLKITSHMRAAVGLVAAVAIAGCSAQTDHVPSADRQAAMDVLKAGGVRVRLSPNNDETRVVSIDFSRSRGGTNELKRVLEFPEVSELRLSGTAFTDADILTLSNLTNLETLDVSGMDNITDHGFAVVTNFTRLRQIRATHLNISDPSLERLGHLKALELVSIGPTEPGPTAESLKAISSRGFAALSGLTNLQSLYIAGRGVLPLQIKDDDLAALAGATNLTSVSFHSCPLTGKGLTHLNAPTLRKLRMTLASVDEAGVHAMALFQGLEDLNLYGNKLKGCLGPFAEGGTFGSLKKLSLMDSGIGDDDVAMLSKLPSLEYLILEYCPVTDKALPLVERLSALKTLNVMRTDVTKEAAEKFRRDTGVEVYARQ